MRIVCILFSFMAFISSYSQNVRSEKWEYVTVDSIKQKWGDWEEPDWLRYFGLNHGDVNRDGLQDIVSGRYIYHNPGGAMTQTWKRTVLDDNVDGIFIINVDDDPLADIIAMALPDLFWYEATDESATQFTRRLIANVPATSHVNSQGFEKADIIKGGKEELLIAGNGNVYCIQIPESPMSVELWPTNLLAARTSDEGIGVGDIDGDGDLDISCGRRPDGEGEPKFLVWYENPGHAKSAWNDYEIGHTTHPIDRIEIVDLDGDGHTEIILAEERYPGLEPDGSIFFYTRNKDITKEWTHHTIVTQYSSNNLDIADYDRDGDIDILTGEHKGEALELQIWENNGRAQFTKKVVDTGKENHLGTMWVDLDADGDLDIIGAGWDHYQYVHAWRNDQIRTPEEGDIYREYHWKRGDDDAEAFLRVGGKFDYRKYPKYFPFNEHQDGYIRLADYIDMNMASHAEVWIERLQSHEGTKGLEIQINEGAYQTIPFPATLPDDGHEYLFHHIAKVPVSLATIKEGIMDFRFKVDTAQSWGWPQNIIYGVTLRVFYHPGKSNITAELTGLNDGQVITDQRTISLRAENLSEIARVEYLGMYEDVDMDGDGVYRQWQSQRHRTKTSGIIGTTSMFPYEVTWNTQDIPDQTGVSLIARIVTHSGLYINSSAVHDITIDNEEDVYLIKPYNQPKAWATRSDTFHQNVNIPKDLKAMHDVSAHWRSWSPCYSVGFLINGNEIKESEQDWPCYAYDVHQGKWQIQEHLQSGKNTLSTLKTPLYDGQMVHGMEVQWPGIMLKMKAVKSDSDIIVSEAIYEGAPHFIIKTNDATYYYDRSGGGFSRIIDPLGNDWISFKREPWGEYPASAASSFRGLPNLVFQGDNDGAGHPGHEQCTSHIEGKSIITETFDGRWQWSWTFENDHVRLDILKTDESRKYWFLYEGTPGGRFIADQMYYGTDAGGPSYQKWDYYRGNIYQNNMKWWYAGRINQKRVFFIKHVTHDDEIDMISLLGNSEDGMESNDGMTVWGFGRNTKTQPLLSGKHSFIIGFYPKNISNTTDHRKFEKYLAKLNQE